MTTRRLSTRTRKACRARPRCSGNRSSPSAPGCFGQHRDFAGQHRIHRAVFKHIIYPFGAIGFVVLTYLVIVGTSNAVNLTDGLDGLAIMPTAMVSAAMAIFAYVAGHAVFSKYLGLPYIPGAGELAVFCAAIGGGLGFSGSTPIRLKCSWAMLAHWRWALRWAPLLWWCVRKSCCSSWAGVRDGSDFGDGAGGLVQAHRPACVRMAPLHHHYELKGWEGNAGCGVLDHHHRAGADWFVD